MKIKELIKGTKYGKYLIPALIAVVAVIFAIPSNSKNETDDTTTYVMLSYELEEKIESLC